MVDYYNSLVLRDAIRNQVNERYIKFICNLCGQPEVSEVKVGRNRLICPECGYDNGIHIEEA